MIAIILDDVATDLNELVAHYNPLNIHNCTHSDWERTQRNYGSVLACINQCVDGTDFYYRHNSSQDPLSYLHMNDYIRQNGSTEIMCMKHWRRTIKLK